MKGLMVPLLMLMMTGIVVGQQTDSNSFRSTAYRQGPESSTQGSGNFSALTNQSDIKPFDLSVTDEQIKGIRNGGGLLSKIEPRDQKTGQLLSLRVINAITLIHEKNANRQITVRKMYGKDAGDGKIEFELDEWALRDLETNKLSFDVPAADRGRFNQVAFYYKAPKPPAKSVLGAGSGSKAAGPTPDDGAGSSQFKFGQPNQGSFGFLPLPGPEAVPGDVEFEGPVMPSRTQQIAENNRPAGWNPNANTPTNPAVTNQGSGSNQSPGWTIPQVNPRQETLAEYQNRLALEKWKQEQLDAQLKQQELARIQRANDAKRGQLGGTGWADLVQPNQPSLTEQQIAERLAFLKRQQEIKNYEDNLAVREAALAKQKKEWEYQRFVESLKVNRNDDIIPQITRQMGPVPGTDYRPSGPVLERQQPARFASSDTDQNYGSAFSSNGQTAPPSRQASNSIGPVPTGGVGKYQASIPGGGNRGAAEPNANGSTSSMLTKMTDTMAANRLGIDSEAKQTREKSIEGFIYFMLLCSLGLNIYLGLISRGFYVRYNELADELRETFTATM